MVYDSGALIALDNLHDRSAADRHRRLLQLSHKILVPTVVAAQVVRKPAARNQALVVSTDAGDIRHLLDCLGVQLPVLSI